MSQLLPLSLDKFNSPIGSVVEMQVVTTLLVKSFEFSVTPGSKMKMLPNQFILMPVLEGKEDEGPQVPLQFKIIE